MSDDILVENKDNVLQGSLGSQDQRRPSYADEVRQVKLTADGAIELANKAIQSIQYSINLLADKTVPEKFRDRIIKDIYEQKRHIDELVENAQGANTRLKELGIPVNDFKLNNITQKAQQIGQTVYCGTLSTQNECGQYPYCAWNNDNKHCWSNYDYPYKPGPCNKGNPYYRDYSRSRSRSGPRFRGSHGGSFKVNYCGDFKKMGMVAKKKCGPEDYLNPACSFNTHTNKLANVFMGRHVSPRRRSK